MLNIWHGIGSEWAFDVYRSLLAFIRVSSHFIDIPLIISLKNHLENSELGFGNPMFVRQEFVVG